MTYQEYKNARQKEVGDLPLKWAFGNEQFKEMMNEWGLKEDEYDKIGTIGAGGYYLKKDRDIIIAFFTKPSDLKKLMRDKKFAIEAFEYEMANHEYAINYQGDWDVCNCFSSKELEFEEGKGYTEYLTEAKYPKYVIEYYEEARKNYIQYDLSH